MWGVTHNGDTIIVNVCQLVELFLDLGVFPLWSGARRSAHVSVKQVTRIAWSFETTGVGERHTRRHQDEGWSC